MRMHLYVAMSCAFAAEQHRPDCGCQQQLLCFWPHPHCPAHRSPARHHLLLQVRTLISCVIRTTASLPKHLRSHGISIHCLTVLITVQECECQASIAERHAHLLVDLSTCILSGGSAAGLETLLPPHQMQHQQSSSSGQASRWELTASRRPSAWWLTWG